MFRIKKQKRIRTLAFYAAIINSWHFLKRDVLVSSLSLLFLVLFSRTSVLSWAEQNTYQFPPGKSPYSDKNYVARHMNELHVTPNTYGSPHEGRIYYRCVLKINEKINKSRNPLEFSLF